MGYYIHPISPSADALRPLLLEGRVGGCRLETGGAADSILTAENRRILLTCCLLTPVLLTPP